MCRFSAPVVSNVCPEVARDYALIARCVYGTAPRMLVARRRRARRPERSPAASSACSASLIAQASRSTSCAAAWPVLRWTECTCSSRSTGVWSVRSDETGSVVTMILGMEFPLSGGWQSWRAHAGRDRAACPGSSSWGGPLPSPRQEVDERQMRIHRPVTPNSACSTLVQSPRTVTGAEPVGVRSDIVNQTYRDYEENQGAIPGGHGPGTSPRARVACVR